MKMLTKLLVAVLLSSAMTAQAAIITYNFEAIVVDGTFAGQSGEGVFSYDDSNLNDAVYCNYLGVLGSCTLAPSGSTFVDFDDLTNFSFTFLGQTYSLSNDLGFPDTPTLDIFDFVPDYLDFFVEDKANLDIINPLIEDFQLVGVLDASNNGYDFVVDMFITERVVNNVNAPNMLSLVPLFLAALFFRKSNFRQNRRRQTNAL